MEKPGKDILFLGSGCLSREGLKQFLAGELDPESRQAVEKHIESCPLCKEAVEGISQTEPEMFDSSMERLNSRLLHGTHTGSTETGKKGFNLKWVAAAASIALLAGVFSIYVYLFRNEEMVSQSELAYTEEAPTESIVKPTETEQPKQLVADMEEQPVQPVADMEKEPAQIAKDKGETINQPAQVAEYEESLKKMFIAEDMEEENDTEEGAAIAMDAPEKYSLRSKAAPSAKGIKAETDTKPEFSKPTYTDLGDFITKEMQYPDSALKANLSGLVKLRIIINKNGEIIKSSVEKSSDPVFEEEALRLIKLSGPWQAARKNGERIEGELLLDIIFTLPGEE